MLRRWCVAKPGWCRADVKQLLTLWSLEHARAAQKLTCRACTAVSRTGARRRRRETTLDTDRADGSGSHGGTEVGGPPGGVAARSRRNAGAGRGETRHVPVLLKGLSGEGLQVDVESEVARTKPHDPGCVQRCLDKTSGACRSRE